MSSSNRSKNLLWIDLEMTGLNPDTDHIIEIAMIATDAQLNILGESPVLAIWQPEEKLAVMDEWNVKHHSSSGLLERVRASTIKEQQAEEIMLEFAAKYITANKSPMCGNSICQDRRFLYRFMPKLEKFFHYRNLDVSTLKELAKRWVPELHKGFKKKSKHQALDDIKDSIMELRYYKEKWLNGAQEKIINSSVEEE